MKRIRVVMFVLLACIFMMLGPLNVFAVSDIDSSKEKSLTIYFYVQKLGIDKPIEGANIGISKIADIEVNNGNIEYTVVNKYNELSNTKFEGITVDESKEIARNFDKVVEIDYRGITLSNGTCEFKGLDSGVYLVKQLSAEGKAEGFAKFEPYIILVPYVDNYLPEWNYDILSEPKTVTIVEESEKSTPDTSVDEESDESSDESSDEPDITDNSDIEFSDRHESISENSWQNLDNSGVLTGDTMYSIILGCIGLMFLSVLIIIFISRKTDE